MKLLSEIYPNPKNPRLIKDDKFKKLVQSLKDFPKMMSLRPIIIDENNMILGGNMRYKALQELGYMEILDEWVKKDSELTEEEKKEFTIKDNIGFGDWDYDLLSADFNMEELSEWGLDSLDLGMMESPKEIIEDDVPEVGSVETRVKLGDIWQLGRHRLLCGDCCIIDNIAKLFDGLSVNMILTDPHGVDYAGKNDFLNNFDKGNSNQTPIENDAIGDYKQFFSDFLSIIPISDYNTFYVFMSGQQLHNLRLAFDDCNIKWGDYLVWVKNNHVLGRKDYNAKHEFCVYGWKNHHKFYGDFSTTVLEFDKPLKNDLHPTMKPIELLAKLIKDGSQKDEIVYDAFLGSGSTLIAGEQTNRVCYGCEISPQYCDVIIKRWEKFTGQQAILLI